MTRQSASTWQRMKKPESDMIEKHLSPHFEQVDSYRYNSASIRVRVIDSKFKGVSDDRRDRMVDKYLKDLPENIRGDIMVLLTLAPGEENELSGRALVNQEFEKPSRSTL